jgi:hypothetical protein
MGRLQIPISRKGREKWGTGPLFDQGGFHEDGFVQDDKTN